MASARLKLVRPLLAAAMLVAVPEESSAQASELHGRVVSADGAPIAGAMVTLVGVRYSIKSDSLGQFRFAGPPGSTLALSFRANGFRDDTASVVLTRRRPVVRDFVLVSEQTPLPEANPSGRVLRGRVSTTDGEPISYANVQINGGHRFVSDDSGRFNLSLTVSGTFSLLIRRVGFKPVEVKLASMPDTVVTVRMTAIATSLPEQRVTGSAPFVSLDLRGFYRRMRDAERGINHGYFVTPEDLSLRNPLNVTDAVEQFPSLRTRPSNAEQTWSKEGGFRNLPVPRNMRIEDRSGCILTVYLDGIRIQPSSRMKNGELEDTQVNSLVNPGSVAGIEVYPRAVGAPPEFPVVSSTCGVVLIWTK
jgi:hypothetical protein